MKAIELPSDQPLIEHSLSPSCWISYWPQWIDRPKADLCFAQLHEELDWQAGSIRLFGKWVAIPRQHAWYGDAHASYGWSGQRAEAQTWHPLLEDLRNQLSEHCRQPFNGVLANLYRDGSDCMHWHADNEKELGSQPFIAAISLGAQRRFTLRHKQRSYATRRLALAAGSLLLMGGDCQAHWQHALPRSKRLTDPRISLTYRAVNLSPRPTAPTA